MKRSETRRGRPGTPHRAAHAVGPVFLVICLVFVGLVSCELLGGSEDGGSEDGDSNGEEDSGADEADDGTDDNGEDGTDGEDGTGDDSDGSDIVPDPILETSYTGILELQFTNTFPQFDETIRLDVDIDAELGLVTVEFDTMHYEGDETNEQNLRIRRDGTLTIQPTAWLEQDGETIYVQVREDTTLNETYEMWPPGGDPVSETVTDFWDGGLSFDFLEAQTSGSIVSVVTANGSAIWTLTLVPAAEP